MSRLGKLHIDIPDKTEVSVTDGVIRVKGPLGELSKRAHPSVAVTVDDKVIKVTPVEGAENAKALWGTYASHVRNMVAGVTTHYVKKLEIEGVGYRGSVQGQTLELLVGFSHPVRLPIPQGFEVTVEKNLITVKGIDKEAVGQFAANIRAVKKPEPYKGKGIHYVGEYIIRKQGKKSS